MDPALETRIADFRAMRRELETAVLAMATSIDGRAFELQAPVHALYLQPGGYVMLETAEGPRLGQLLALDLRREDAGEIGWSGETTTRTHVQIRIAYGRGALLDGGPPFVDAAVRAATPDELRTWLARSAPTRAHLPAAELALMPGVRYALDAGGFDRHTFLCGQSGSGKTYALGTLLDRLLLETSLRVVILDPNSDFVRLPYPHAEVAPEEAERFRAATRGVVVHRAGAQGSGRLRLRLGELSSAGAAAALRLDPLRDGEEYDAFAALLASATRTSAPDPAVFDGPGGPALARRARNLGIDEWSIWARDDPGSTLEALDDPAVRVLVVDLGSLATRGEQALVAQAVLEHLWARRERRDPVLIAIDEAHNICPAEPADPSTALAAELAERIAAEGRKFGLYLLTSTQRPQKVRPNVVSQCDNLILMRMNSASDLDYLGGVFSFAPPGMLARAAAFRQGEALVAGKISSHPAFVRVGPRVSTEGGADVPADWAARA